MTALFWLSEEDEESHGQRVVREKDETGGLTDLALLKCVLNYKLWNVNSCCTGDTGYICAQFN